jgi:hypothetical protein
MTTLAVSGQVRVSRDSNAPSKWGGKTHQKGEIQIKKGEIFVDCGADRSPLFIFLQHSFSEMN